MNEVHTVFTMENIMTKEKTIKQLLDQLEKVSGIRFSIENSSLNEEDTLNKLRDLLIHYSVIDNKDSFLMNYLKGLVPADDAVKAFHRYHIDDSKIYNCYYMESNKAYSEDIVSLIKSVIPDSGATILEMDSNHIAVLAEYSPSNSSEDIKQSALDLLDLLETEGYIQFKLAYDEPTNILNLPKAFTNAGMAMSIGNIFYGRERIFHFNELGLGRLLYNIPKEECEAFLNNKVNVNALSTIDEEILGSVLTFFENDLSIAETARKQFLHRNTLIYRLDKFQSITGLDVRKFSDATTCLLALMLKDYINS